MDTEWETSLDASFVPEFRRFPQAVQDGVLASARMLQKLGPILGRPYVDTLKGSAYPNMKELRFGVDKGVWRVAFAFDPERKAILFCAGNKAGQDQQKFYKKLIALADQRFKDHLDGLQRPRR